MRRKILFILLVCLLLALGRVLDLRILVQKSSESSAQTLLGNSQQRISDKKLCIFHQEKHFSNMCRKVPDFKSRLEFVKGKQLCRICLKHKFISGCPERDQRSCFYCKKDSHHSALCKTKFDKTENPHSGVGTTVCGSEYSLNLPQRHKDVRLKTAWTTIRKPGVASDCISTGMLLDDSGDRA